MYFSFLFGTNSTKRSENDKNSSARFAYNCLGYLVILVLSILERKSEIWLFDKFRMGEDESELTVSQNDQDEGPSLERRRTTHNKINFSFQGKNQHDSLLNSAPNKFFSRDSNKSVTFPELSVNRNKKFIDRKLYQKEVARILSKKHKYIIYRACSSILYAVIVL